MEAGFVAARGRRSAEAPDHARSKYGDASTSFEGANNGAPGADNGAPGADNGNAAKLQRKAQLELKIKELDRQIEEQRSQERALAEQEDQHRKDMGNTAILTPTQEKAALQSREVGIQQDAVSDKTEQLVKEKLELLKELEKIQIEEGKGKPEEEITPGETVTREIVGPAGEKEIEVVKEEEGGKEEVEEVKEETPEEAKQMKENGGQIVSPPPAPSPEVQEAEAEMGGDGGYYGPGGPVGAPEPVKCPPCPPLPKARERMLMVSAEDEPPGKAPKVEVDVTESAEVPQQTFLFAPPAASVKNVRLKMPAPQRLVSLDTAGDDHVQWEMPPHTPGLMIGSNSSSLAGGLLDEEVVDENEVPEEYDGEQPPTQEEIMEAQRGGHAFGKMMDVQQQGLFCLPPFAFGKSFEPHSRGPRRRAGDMFL